MELSPRFWSGVDDVLAAVGFLFVLGPIAVVGMANTSVGLVGWWGGLVLVSAAAGAVYRQLGYDIGDLGSFVLAASISFVLVALLVNAVSLFVGTEIPGESGPAVTVGGAYALTHWYAYRGGRERTRGPG